MSDLVKFVRVRHDVMPAAPPDGLRLWRRAPPGGECPLNDRYPYVRFVVDAAPFIAGGIALITFLAGTLRACGHGGFGGLVGFLVSAVVACIVYVVVMVKIEILQVLLDIEGGTRRLQTAPPPKDPGSPTASSGV